MIHHRPLHNRGRRPMGHLTVVVLAALALGGIASVWTTGGRTAHRPRSARGIAFRVHAADPPPQTSAVVYLPLAGRAMQLRVLEPVRFSYLAGLRSSGFELQIGHRDAHAVIRFTRDGSVPTRTAGEGYAGPIVIDRTTILRAVAFRDGFQPSEVQTRTWIFPEDIPSQGPRPTGWPDRWGVFPEGPDDGPRGYRGRPIPPDYGMAPDVVDDPRYARTLPDDLRTIPSVSLVVEPSDLFGPDGIYSNPMADRPGWRHPITGTYVPVERRASIEWLQPDGEAGFQTGVGVRIAGNWSRKPDAMAKHSFSLRFRSRYGVPKLRFPVFAGAPNGAGARAPAAYDSLRLRAGQADSFLYFPGKAQYLHDQWGRDTQRAMGWAAARGTWVHLYLNGLYWGLYNLTEEIDADFAASNLGGAEADWDVIEAAQTEDFGEIFQVAPADGQQAQYGKVEDGSSHEFRELLAARDAGTAVDPVAYDGVVGRLALDQWIDYVLLHLYSDTWDWPVKNWAAARNRHVDMGWRWMIWDMEHTLGLRQDPDRPGVCGPLCARDCGSVSCGRDVDERGVAGLHRWLMASEDYRRAFGDRVRRHLLEDGALAAGPATARYRALADHVERAVVGESARWGDVVFGERTRNENYGFIYPDFQRRPGERSKAQTLHEHWRPERDRLLRDYFPSRGPQLLEQLCDAGLYPRIAALRVTSSASGRGTRVHIDPISEGCTGQTRSGVAWFTLDGTDPRDPETGSPSSSAREYGGPVAVPPGFHRIATRLRTTDGRWGARTDAPFGSPRVVISELMYHPPGPEDPEFIELHNLEAGAVDLSGASLSGGITATLGTVVVPADGRILLSNDAAAFQVRYADAVLTDVYHGQLGNGGETITLTAADGTEIHSISYDDGGFWPLSPDGLGRSLVLRDPGADPDDPETWRGSSVVGGSPGEADPAPAWDGRVVLHEVIGATDPPMEDAIELHNPSDAPVDISGWVLSDDLDEPEAYRLPAGTVIPAGGYHVVYEAQLDASPGGGFGVSGDGETIYLGSPWGSGLAGGYLRGFEFGATDDNVAYGRVRTAAGLFAAPLQRPTFGVADPGSVEEFRTGGGAPNGPPRVGPVIVAEILAKPGQDPTEFIELHNQSTETIHLGGAPDGSTAPWALVDGVNFLMPEGLTVAPGGRVLVVGTDADHFRTLIDVPQGVPVVGPWDGGLDVGGERIALARPPRGDPADIEAGAWFVQDEVDWRRASPWPAEGLTGGASLTRRRPVRYGNVPGGWSAAVIGGTPGRASPGEADDTRAYLPLAANRGRPRADDAPDDVGGASRARPAHDRGPVTDQPRR